jgi:hypothetical protein
MLLTPKVRLPCGCAGSRAVLLGLDGEPLKGVVAANTETGWVKLLHATVWPDAMPPDPKHAFEVRASSGNLSRAAAMRAVERVPQFTAVIAPFEARCVRHGRLSETPCV